jgi:hypothetical protein
MLLLNQEHPKIDKVSQGSRFTFKILQPEQIELDNKLKYNLSKLYEINDYFIDVKHPYLLNSDMQPEIIRKIKNEENITDVFNILKDILQLDKNIYFKDEDIDY